MRRVALAAAAVLALLAAPARAATPSTVTLRGDRTHDNRVTGAPEPPLGVRWAVELGTDVSYPVVAEGSVFVTVRPTETGPYGTEIVALDLATGRVKWRRAEGGTYYWSALAYDQGRLVVVNGDGRVRALSPATGAPLWQTQLSQYSFSTPPVAYDGRIYLTGAGSGMTAYSVRANDGGVEWEQSLPSGAGTPAVDTGSVYVSMVCQHAVALSRATGAVRWEHHGDCAGGGEATPALHGGRIYPLGDNGLVYDAASGATVGSADFHGAVAFADGVGYVPWLNGLLAVDARTWATRWRVPADSETGLNGEAPLVSGSHLYVGSESGYVAALDRSTGAMAWCASTAGEPVQGATGNVDRPDSGLGAGGGMLLVPAGRFLVAYGPGGAAPAPCAGAGTAAPPPGAAPVGPSLTLRARNRVLAGRRVRLRGTLARTVTAVGGVPVAVERDTWPFDGRWKRAGAGVTAADGSFALRVRPRRNTRYRAQAAGLTSGAETVWADLAVRFRRRDLGGRRFRETLLLSGPRSIRVRARRIHMYVVRAGALRARRRASPRLQRVRPGAYRAAATLRYLRPRRQTVVLACYREAKPDPWGQPTTLDPVCGRRRLRLPAPAQRAAAATTLPRDAAARFTAR